MAGDYRALAAHRRFELADLLSNAGKKPDSVPVFEKATAEYESLAHDYPQVPEYRHSLAQILTRVGDQKRVQGYTDVAESFYRRALPIADELARDYPEVPSYRLGPIAERTSLAKLAVKRRDPAAACAAPLLSTCFKRGRTGLQICNAERSAMTVAGRTRRGGSHGDRWAGARVDGV